MKSNYKRIGDYIRGVNVRNTELKVNNLLGINIEKFFMPSVANIVGTDLTKYKIVKKGQFACNRMHVGRDKRLPVALLKQADDIIVSPAYDVFEIIDEDVLDPEYLMMWFLRKEFDRNAWFFTDADVRGGLNWTDFCNMQLPVPSITKQKEIVKEFNVLVKKINLNNQLIQRLEETAHALYKQWFIDFDFPNQNELPYKSNGGKMELSKEVDKEIPRGWKVEKLGYLISDTKGGDWGRSKKEGNYDSQVYCIRGADIPNLREGILGNMPERFILEKNLLAKQLSSNQIVIEISGGSPTQSTGRTILITDSLLKHMRYPLICSNFCQALTVSDSEYTNFLYSHINYLYKLDVFFNYENSTIGLKNLDLTGIMAEELIVIPSKEILERYNTLYENINNSILSYGREASAISKHLDLLLANLMVAKTKENIL